MADALSNETQYYVSDEMGEAELMQIIKAAKQHKQIILAIHDARSRPRPELPASDAVKRLVEKLAKRSIVTFFTNPYALDGFSGVHKSKTILVAYQNDDFMQRAVAKTILGENIPTAKLPVTINKYFKYGAGK
jgi:hypothetical protein